MKEQKLMIPQGSVVLCEDYSKIKWPLRAAIMGYTAAVGMALAGGIALLGFENGFYSSCK